MTAEGGALLSETQPRLIRRWRRSPVSGQKEDYYCGEWVDAQGRRRSKAFGFISEAEATHHMAALRADIRSGRAGPPQARRPSALAGLTLREFLFETYLPHRAQVVRKATHAANVGHAKALAATIGKAPLRRVGGAEARAHEEARRSAGVGDKTVYNELSTLRCALRHASRLGLIRELPVIEATMFRRTPQPWLTKDESIALLRVLDRGRGKKQHLDDLHLAVMVALNTGMRRGEVLSRTWDDLRWNDGPLGVLMVCRKDSIGFNTKSGKPRVIPLTPELRAVLRHRHRRRGAPNDGWIFPGMNASRPRTTFPPGLKAACRRADVPEITPHALRRSWASRLAVGGVDRAALLVLGGWTEGGAVLDQVYAQVTAVHVANMMARMGIGPR